MAQVFVNKENIGVLTIQNSTTIKLSSSAITIGALQYISNNLTCNTAISGVGGLDAGSVAANEKYYVYAVVDSGVMKLIASTSSLAPVGYTVFERIDFFITDLASDIESIGEQATTKFQEKALTTTFSGLGEVTELTFNNLEIGKSYRATYSIHCFGSANSVNSIFVGSVFNGATKIKDWSHAHYLTNQGAGSDITVIVNFVATSTVLELHIDSARLNTSESANAYIRAGVDGRQTSAMLEELSNYKTTTKWT